VLGHPGREIEKGRGDERGLVEHARHFLQSNVVGRRRGGPRHHTNDTTLPEGNLDA
jgi:hypothetical protein